MVYNVYMQNVYESTDQRKFKSNLIVFGFSLFILAAAYFISTALSYYMYGFFDSGLVIGSAVILTGLTTFSSYYYSDRIIASISGARRIKSQEFPVYHQVVDNLCLASGLPKPQLYVIDDSAMNAFAAGRSPDHSLVCATTGLISRLNRTELEAVIGHELTHIQNYDTRLMSLAAIMVGSVTLLADWLIRIGFRSRRNRNSGSLSGITLILGLLAALMAPIIGQLIQLAISRSREYLADVGSVKLTRQPSGLISALQKISSDAEPLEAANKSTAHLYFTNPFHQDATVGLHSNRPALEWFSGLFNTHPPISDRIKALENMA